MKLHCLLGHVGDYTILTPPITTYAMLIRCHTCDCEVRQFSYHFSILGKGVSEKFFHVYAIVPFNNFSTKMIVSEKSVLRKR